MCEFGFGVIIAWHPVFLARTKEKESRLSDSWNALLSAPLLPKQKVSIVLLSLFVLFLSLFLFLPSLAVPPSCCLWLIHLFAAGLAACTTNTSMPILLLLLLLMMLTMMMIFLLLFLLLHPYSLLLLPVPFILLVIILLLFPRLIAPHFPSASLCFIIVPVLSLPHPLPHEDGNFSLHSIISSLCFLSDRKLVFGFFSFSFNRNAINN